MTADTPRSVAVLAGGLSFERSISLQSGSRMADALSDAGHDVTLIDVDASLTDQLASGRFDVAAIALHGAAGDDGTVQQLCHLLDLHHTGSSPRACARAWNKATAQALFDDAGLTTPPRAVLTDIAFRDLGATRATDRLFARLGDQLVVKPAMSGSSMGLTVVESFEDMTQALLGALSISSTVIVEAFIEGTEIAVPLLGDTLFGPIEIETADGAYDFAARYSAGATTFHDPARIKPDLLDVACEAAQTAFDVLGVTGIGRADMVATDNDVFLLEVDTCPGLTETSLVPFAWETAGIDFGDACTQLVELALR